MDHLGREGRSQGFEPPVQRPGRRSRGGSNSLARNEVEGVLVVEAFKWRGLLCRGWTAISGVVEGDTFTSKVMNDLTAQIRIIYLVKRSRIR